ncbi:MAG: HU family DNA-binding protein [Candidatus Symbiothrix sp.]|jgi:nucleoid DNA-binding protein|nr:HU family DNA-binding protein [Candidatus Symbiothrix sp.]
MNEKINLQELISLLAGKSGITKKEAEQFLKECFDTINEALVEDKLVKVKNLGSFKLIVAEDRESVDVTNGTRVLIPAHYKVSYAPDNQLAETINEPFSLFETVELIGEIEEEIPVAEETPTMEETPIVEEVLPIVPEEIIVEEIPEKVIEEEVIEETETKTEVERDDEREGMREKRKEKIHCCWIILSILLLLIAGAYLYTYLRTKPEKIPVVEREFIVEPVIMEEPQEKIVETVPETIPQKNIVKEVKVKEAKPVTPVPSGNVKSRTIAPGERLTLISLEEYGHKAFWVYIYEENKNTIKSPDLVMTGMKLIIPPAAKYGIDKNNEESIKKAQKLAESYLKGD